MQRIEQGVLRVQMYDVWRIIDPGVWGVGFDINLRLACVHAFIVHSTILHTH